MYSHGIYHEGWFAGVFGPLTPWLSDMSALKDWDPSRDEWELYNLDEDYSQSKNLAKENPKKLAELKTLFDKEATENHVYPVGASMYTVFFHPEELPSSPLKEWTFYDGPERLDPATVILRVNGKEVGKGRIEQSVPAAHTSSETFDIGIDLGSPVALDYYDRAPFRFNGKIGKINIKYIE